MWCFRFGGDVCQRITYTRILGQLCLIIAYATHFIVRRFEQGICDQYDLRVVAVLEALYPVALLVKQIGRYFDR